jgi:hypothetical protein
MLLPLILAVLDEILIRQRHRASWSGVLLGLLLFAQFFLSSELLAIAVVVILICIVALVVAGLVGDRQGLQRRAPHAAEALVVGGVVGAGLLAWPVWFALEGPAHLSGLIWPNVGVIGGYVPASFVTTEYPPRLHSFLPLSGYSGPPLASAAYLGWGFLLVIAGGLAAFWRARRLWFFTFVFAVCVVFSLGERRGQWEPAWIFSRIPVIDNVIEQRFMAIGFLAAAVILAVVLDRVHHAVPDWWGAFASLLVTAVALAPMALIFGGRLPFTMQAVVLPRWYTEVAPTLPPGRVLLSYPAPFSGLQSAMAWQAVNDISYSQAGGGGPQGVQRRAGSAAAGFGLLSNLGLGQLAPPPAGTPAQLAAVRHALSVWKVNTVVVATDPALPTTQLGRDTLYAAAFMTAALGEAPTLQAGAWVWDDVRLDLHPALRIGPDSLEGCVRPVEGPTERQVAVTQLVPACVIAQGGTDHG